MPRSDPNLSSKEKEKDVDVTVEEITGSAR